MSGETGQHEDLLFNDVVDQALREAVQVVFQRRGSGPTAQALLLLLTRVASTWRSIATLWGALRQTCPETFMVDAGTLLRAMYDAYLQAAFILHDPDKRDERARLYLEFEHLERWKMIQRVLEHDSFLSQHLRASPRRANGEVRARAEYDRVKEQYPRDGASGVRNSWYPGNLRELAKEVGKDREYDQLLASFQGCVHSSAFALLYGPPVAPEEVSALASTIAAGLAKAALEQVGVKLRSPLQEAIDTLGADFLEAP